ncbi:MAG TPA: right-handed parallel beta-helix repeat-containing protein [Phycisphaerales bacterium]|nr:right-handed parallel beta-helix repeat-containing protein [Phycisphaerales bacterium]
MNAMRCPTSFVSLTLALGLFAASGHAATIRVPADQPTIQSAINAASPGDVILVSPGTYTEQINLLGKPLTLRGIGGVGGVVIDGNGLPGAVVLFASGETSATIMENFTITGAKGSAGATAAGVRILQASPTLRRLVIQDNDAGQGGSGGGIYVRGGAPVISQTVFASNTALFGGGFASESSHATLTECIFEDNLSWNGGGAAFFTGGKAIIRDSWFTSNRSQNLGGAIHVNQAQMDIRRINVRDNGWFEDQPNGTRVYYTVGGGGIYTRSASGTVAESLFAGNVGAFGGGIYVATYGSSPTFINCIVAENDGQGGIYCNDSRPRFINNTVISNTFGGVYTTSAARPVVANSIVAGHSTTALTGVDIFGAGLAQVSYSLIQGQTLNGTELGAGVIRGNPKLGADFRPMTGSAVIDAGDNTRVPPGVTADFYGLARFVDAPEVVDAGVGFPTVDLGAVEFQPEAAGALCVADFNRSGFVDTDDFDSFIAMFEMGAMTADVDGSGFVDGDDFDAFVTAFESGC